MELDLIITLMTKSNDKARCCGADAGAFFFFSSLLFSPLSSHSTLPSLPSLFLSCALPFFILSPPSFPSSPLFFLSCFFSSHLSPSLALSLLELTLGHHSNLIIQRYEYLWISPFRGHFRERS